MFLPHICASLTSDHHLAKMFLIYSRVLCWDKLGNNEDPNAMNEKTEDQNDEENSDAEEGEAEQAWESVQQSMEYPDSSPPTLMHYFTFLYGLFPLNFMHFVRKPRRFLKTLNFPGARDFDLDQDLIQSRTEPYRRVHLLHPNMFSTTQEEELQDNRWAKSDPADVVTECMDLCVAVTSTLEQPGPPPSAALPAIPVPPVPEIPKQLRLDDDGTTMNDSDASWRNTQSTVFVPPSEGPDMPQTFETPPPAKSTKSIKSGKSSPMLKPRDAMDSPTLPPAKNTTKANLAGAPVSPSQGYVAKKPSLDDFVQSVTARSPSHGDFRGQTMASLQREIMLLRNDLNFERYLKLQHLTHIGQLQRKHIREATAEAETQNLINNNRTLKARLAKANELYAQLKKETLTSRNQSKKWESDLSARVRTYRDSEKTWHSEEDSLRYELQRTQADYEHLKQIVEKAEAEQIKAQQRTRALEYELEDYGNVRRELEAAQDKIMTFEDSRKELHTLLQERNDLRNDLEISNMRVNSRELERERSFKAYERRILELETRLQVTERNTGRPGQLPSSVQQMLDSTLAASNAKLQQLKKTHYHLLEQYTELQMKCHELEAQKQVEQGRHQSQERSGHLDYEKARLSRSASTSMRQPNNYNSRYLPSLTTEGSPIEEHEPYNDYQSPNSVSSPSSSRPQRHEPTQRPQRSQTAPSPYPGFGGNYGPDFSSAYDASLNTQFQVQPQSSAPQSDGKSSYSVDTDGSNGKEQKPKVDPKSEVRYFGRGEYLISDVLSAVSTNRPIGGAQNIGKKVKDKDQKKPGTSKTGGFRGLKGIM
jgi:hypothetical protein